MKDYLAKLLLVLFDLFGVFAALVIAFNMRNMISIHELEHHIPLSAYLQFYMLYIIIISTMGYEGIYTNRYDFWQECRQLVCAISFSFMITATFLTLTKTGHEYSRIVIVTAFLLMFIIIPIIKRAVKFSLYYLNVWKLPVKIYGSDPLLSQELLSNPYLGYQLTKDNNARTIFINGAKKDTNLSEIIDDELHKHHEVIFIPQVNDYDLTQTHIYTLFNTRTNLMVFQNKLYSQYRRLLKLFSNYLFAIILLPILLPMIAVIAWLIKRESPGPIFFAHQRIGKNGKIIPTFKFRSMYPDAQKRLNELLKDNPEVLAEWEHNFKLKDDPRVTKIGKFLRESSLDELPQIFNVLRGEMNFIGPRPVIQQEIDLYYKENAKFYFMVKPGITGLWQVSGRSDTDYEFRIKTDKWYVVNWSIWLDIAILFKTVGVVLRRDGAY